MNLETSCKSKEQIVNELRKQASPINLNDIKTNKLIADLKSISYDNFRQW
jgi:hypothetical protein